MLKIHQVIRSFHTSRVWMSDKKTLLSALRKKTGYPLTNCKQALEACDNDLAKAQTWLKEQAIALGWAKAYKLSGRSAIQGLIAVTTDKKSATMVEVNCETDFVAKNEIFQNLAFIVANTCFSLAKEQSQFENSVAKVELDTLQLKNMPGTEGRKLEDEVAIVVSQLGENVQLRRATCLKVSDELLVAASTHPVTAERDSILLGKYGSFLVYKAENDNQNAENIAQKLCQHIIGMNPTKIGEVEEDQPKENKDAESCLIHQDFFMEAEDEGSVLEVLKKNGMSLIEFSRFECGEDLEETSSHVHEQEPIHNVA